MISVLMAATTYPTDISALVLVDVLNDFLSQEGKINPRIKDQIEKHGFLEKVSRLISGGRCSDCVRSSRTP
jgi:ureidoacrylate peracid hydrolase